MGSGLDDELAALRARAYGADADIHDDPEALTRLHELERQRAVVAPPVPPTEASPPSPETPPPLPPLPPQTAATVAATPAAEAVDTTTAPTERGGTLGGRRIIAVAAVAAIAAAAVTVPLTLGASSIAERPYAVLYPADPESTSFFTSTEKPQTYDDLFGIRVTRGLIPGQGTCLVVEPSRRTTDGTRGACSPPGFSPIVDVAVDALLPDEAQEQFANARALRFELVGDEVHVFVATAPAHDSES